MTEAKESREEFRWGGRDAGWLSSTSFQEPAVLWAAEKLPKGASTVIPSKSLMGGKGPRQGRLERRKAIIKGRPRRHGSCKEGEGTRKQLCRGQQKPQEWAQEVEAQRDRRQFAVQGRSRLSLNVCLRQIVKGPQMPKLSLSSDNPLFKFIKLIWLCQVLVVARTTFGCGMGDQVPWPGIKPWPLVLGVQSLRHWTTKELPDIPL